MMTTASRPAAASSPAVTAIWCPKLRASAITVTRVVGRAQLEQQVQRLVAAAVVDVDELEVEVGPLVRRGRPAPRGTPRCRRPRCGPAARRRPVVERGSCIVSRSRGRGGRRYCVVAVRPLWSLCVRPVSSRSGPPRLPTRAFGRRRDRSPITSLSVSFLRRLPWFAVPLAIFAADARSSTPSMLLVLAPCRRSTGRRAARSHLLVPTLVDPAGPTSTCRQLGRAVVPLIVEHGYPGHMPAVDGVVQVTSGRSTRCTRLWSACDVDWPPVRCRGLPRQSWLRRRPRCA